MGICALHYRPDQMIILTAKSVRKQYFVAKLPSCSSLRDYLKRPKQQKAVFLDQQDYSESEI